MLGNSPFIWGLFLILGFPILTIALGESIEKLKRQHNPFAKVLFNIRNWLLPPLAVLLVMRNILEINSGYIYLNIVETLFGISLIYILILLINTILTTSGKPRKSWQIEVSNLLFQVIRGVVILGIAAYILGIVWKVDLTRLASAAGVGSLVMALALQDTLSNLVSGFLLILEAPFKIGDWIKIDDTEGEVIEINWRAVRLKTRERDVVIIPNGKLCKDTIQNYTILDPLHVVRMKVRFSYIDAPNKVIKMLSQTAIATEGIVSNPLPNINIQNYINNTAIEYEVKVCILNFTDLEEIEAEFMTRVYYAAKRYKLNLVYLTTIVHSMKDLPSDGSINVEEIPVSLQKIPLFTSLNHQTIENLAKSTTINYFGIGERIIQAGEIDNSIYIILEGNVLLTVKDSNNQQQQVAFLSNEDLFGETALLQEEISQISATATDDLKVISIQADILRSIINEYPKLAVEINSLIQTRKQAINNAKGIEQPKSKNGKLHPILQQDRLL